MRSAGLEIVWMRIGDLGRSMMSLEIGSGMIVEFPCTGEVGCLGCVVWRMEA